MALPMGFEKRVGAISPDIPLRRPVPKNFFGTPRQEDF